MQKDGNGGHKSNLFSGFQRPVTKSLIQYNVTIKILLKSITPPTYPVMGKSEIPRRPKTKSHLISVFKITTNF